MSDEDDSANYGFNLFHQWGMDGGESEDDEDSAAANDKHHEICICNRDDLQQELSRLEINEAGGTSLYGCDLQSVVQRIAAPFPCQCQPQHGVDIDIGTQCHPADYGDGNATPNNNSCIICNILDMRHKNNTIQHYMGSMSQCRGTGGVALRVAGAIDALLGILWRLMVPLQIHKRGESCLISLLPRIKYKHTANNNEYEWDNTLCNNHLQLHPNKNPNFDTIAMNELDTTAMELAMSCLGSIRDLTCGSALNRAAVLEWTPTSMESYRAKPIKNGIHVLSAYVRRYDRVKWEEILSLKERGCPDTSNSSNFDTTTYTARGKKELRLLANALGTIRNTSHSTPDVCRAFFDDGLVDILVWRLMPDTITPHHGQTANDNEVSSSLPDSSKPWRESCFRAAGSLINLAEKCPGVAYQLGSNRQLIYLLMEAWGGASAFKSALNAPSKNTSAKSLKTLPLLHLGLASVLNAAGSGGALEGGLDGVMMQVLEKEQLRKIAAQRSEEERKQRQLVKKNK